MGCQVVSAPEPVVPGLGRACAGVYVCVVAGGVGVGAEEGRGVEALPSLAALLPFISLQFPNPIL